jgi:hypothetical protein
MYWHDALPEVYMIVEEAPPAIVRIGLRGGMSATRSRLSLRALEKDVATLISNLKPKKIKIGSISYLFKGVIEGAIVLTRKAPWSLRCTLNNVVRVLPQVKIL